ncbi:MAG TPA: SUMF1/EgtB/PvdO family nonheme iron enzyme [Steroidobacteraceae bacterium]|nr:SUMF1/EgtB/PvdO family nonheme iron enzyme [Steroidobacteraceae bacterium]
MSDAALTKSSTYAQARIREPAGDRVLGEIFSIGGPGADIVVPGTGLGPVLRIERRKAVWVAQSEGDARVRFDGRPLTRERDLRRNDVMAVGDAQVIVTAESRTLLRLEVSHLAGNATVPSASSIASLASAEDGEDALEIREIVLPVLRPHRDGIDRAATDRRRWLIPAFVAAVLLLALGLVSLMQSVALDVRPLDAEIRTPGTLLAIHSGGRLLLLPGNHIVRAEHDGYIPAQAGVVVRAEGEPPPVRLLLQKLPGQLQIDTQGVAASVSVDGVEVGRAPGLVRVPAGQHTIALQAPRYIDYIGNVDIQGAGARQSLRATLRPSWGTLQIVAVPSGAHISVDGIESGVAPALVAAPSGVRHVRISAPDLQPWESSVVLKAGETLSIGPITLGQPDARLTLRSTPPGADVVIAGVNRGRTPLAVDLPGGVQHQIVVSLPGYAVWTRSLSAQPDQRIGLEAHLQAVMVRVTVQGEPDGGDLFVDGVARGKTPQTLELTDIQHRIEVQKSGFVAFGDQLTPQKGLDRTVVYRLRPDDRSAEIEESAPTVTSYIGYVLRFIPAGTFSMGSERREQGRRPNEGLRKVTLKRPFYMGVTEVTNEQFRKFRADHVSGFIGRNSLDLDSQAVTQVSWEDAVEFCNWLSARDNLPVAYEKRNGKYALIRPLTNGYRLPTEAEWEYASRYAAPGKLYRFAWGDALPWVAQLGNIAGSETGTNSESLAGYHDDYPVVAPVGKFTPTPLGLHDMSGNVSEWIDDYYASFVDPTPATDPLGPDDGTRHVIRGANWRTSTVTELRLAWRDGAEDMSQTIGFRVARYAE